jgi:hypothetical protein
MRKLFVALALLMGILSATLAPAGKSSAQAKSITWKRYDVDITVQADGLLRVVETQEIEFIGGPFTSGFVAIPTANIGVFEVSVSEPGRAYTGYNFRPKDDYAFWVSHPRGETVVEWFFPPVSDETRAFQLAYSVRGAVPRYDDGDVLQFHAISNELEFPILNSTVTVHLPPGGPIIGEPESIGAQMEWEVGDDGLTVVYTSPASIPAYEGVEVGIVFEHGAITGPLPFWQEQELRQAEQTARANLFFGAVTLLLFFLLPGGLYLIWYLKGRDPKAGPVPEYLAEPPSDLPPGLVGVLIDEKADLRDITATLFDFARRGLVSLEAKGQSAFTSALILKTQGKLPAGWRDHEKVLFSSVFDPVSPQPCNLNSMPRDFFLQLPNIEAAMYEEAVKEGLFAASPGSTRSSYKNAGISFLVVGMTLGIAALIFGGSLSPLAVGPALPVALFGLGLLLMSPHMPARTRKGAEEAAKWQAFQKYLSNIQHYKDVATVADQFERYLPYAIAFGLERRWITAFAKAPNAATVQAPGWLRLGSETPIDHSLRRDDTQTLQPRPVAVANRSHIGDSASAPQTPNPGSGQARTDAGPAASSPAPQPPGLSLNQIGDGLINGLNNMGQSVVTALNTGGRSFTGSPFSASGGSPRSSFSGSRSMSSSRSSRSSFGGSSRSSVSRRGSSGGSSFRSSSFRSGGSSGGGRRGFR